MGKSPCCEKDGLKKGPWTPEEDQKLVDYIQIHGHGRWRTLPRNAGLKRCGKSCRLRWTNYLRPDIKRGRFSFEEEETIIQLHSVLGNKWSAIAARLPGRTDNEIKNYWNTHIRKRLLKMGIDPVTHTPRLDLLELSSLLTSSLYNPSSSHHQLHLQNLLGNMGPLVNQNLINLATTLLSYHPKSTSTSTTNPSTTTGFVPQNNVQEISPSGLNVPQNQFQSFQPNIHTSTSTSNSSNVPTYPNETQFVQPKIDQLSQGFTSFNTTSCPNNLWQSSVGDQALFTPSESFVSMTSTKGYLDSTQSSSLLNSLPDQNQASVSCNVPKNTTKVTSFSSLLSTRPSSPNTLNSSSTTYMNSNGSHEDERDSFCSNMFLYDIANYGINDNEFL